MILARRRDFCAMKQTTRQSGIRWITTLGVNINISPVKSVEINRGPLLIQSKKKEEGPNE